MSNKSDRPRLPTLRIAAFVAVVVGSVGACRPLPMQEVNLARTTWALASIDGQPVKVASQPTITFHDLNSVTMASACETFSAALAMETDSDGLSFGEPVSRSTHPCDADVKAQDGPLTEAILDTETWKVVNHQSIELTGSHVLLLERM
jgi:hypothetical protein